jgi:hypothetical protein
MVVERIRFDRQRATLLQILALRTSGYAPALWISSGRPSLLNADMSTELLGDH